METFTRRPKPRALAPYFTNTDRPVFALTNLPETVKGALFARYSRSAKSVRRLFLDEFLGQVARRRRRRRARPRVGTERADQLYARVLSEYGDDSVAQLGGAHIACEGVSNVLTKVLEWGRLMAYLEQSTRYVPYTDRPDGRWKYHVPAEIDRSPLRDAFIAHARHRRSRPTRAGFPRWRRTSARSTRKSPEDSDGVYRSVIRAKALDTLRGLLPAATTSNVGLFGTGQAFEALLLRMFAHPLEEVRACAAADAARAAPGDPGVSRPRRSARSRRPLDRVLRRDAPRVRGAAAEAQSRRPDARRRETDADARSHADRVRSGRRDQSRRRPRSTRSQRCPTISCSPLARRTVGRRSRGRLLRAYVGDRANRRHKPGRAFERTSYRFDVLADYGAFRDLQRHRLLTLDWQPLSPRHGYVEPAAIEEAGALATGATVMDRSADLHAQLIAHGLRDAAPYAVVMAYRVRFYMDMNAAKRCT